MKYYSYIPCILNILVIFVLISYSYGNDLNKIRNISGSIQNSEEVHLDTKRARRKFIYILNIL